MRDALALSRLLGCNSSAPPSPASAPAPPTDAAAAPPNPESPPTTAAAPAGKIELKAVAREPARLSDGTP